MMVKRMMISNRGTSKKILISIVSDVACPWCFVGKRRLEKAIYEFGNKVEFEVKWFPYQLDSRIPVEGVPRDQYLAKKIS